MHLWMESEVQLNPSISCNYYYICWVATMFTWLYSSLCLKSPDRQRRNISYEDLYGSVAKQTCPNGDPTGLFGHIVVVSPGELNVFFHRLGPRGSEAYQGFCTWDLYPFNWHALVVSFDFGRWQLQIPQDEETISIDLVVPSHGLIRLRRNGDSLLRRYHLSRRVRSQIGSNGKSRQSR